MKKSTPPKGVTKPTPQQVLKMLEGIRKSIDVAIEAVKSIAGSGEPKPVARRKKRRTVKATYVNL